MLSSAFRWLLCKSFARISGPIASGTNATAFEQVAPNIYIYILTSVQRFGEEKLSHVSKYDQQLCKKTSQSKWNGIQNHPTAFNNIEHEFNLNISGNFSKFLDKGRSRSRDVGEVEFNSFCLKCFTLQHGKLVQRPLSIATARQQM